MGGEEKGEFGHFKRRGSKSVAEAKFWGWNEEGY